MVLNWIDQAPRRVLALISVACVAMLAFGMYLQHVVGPIARLELIAVQDHQPADNVSPDHLIEAQIPAQQFKEMGFKEGETLVVTPRRARVFLDHAAGI